MKRLLSTLALAVTVFAAGAYADEPAYDANQTETTYNARTAKRPTFSGLPGPELMSNETVYGARNARGKMPSMPGSVVESTETRYNPAGTHSESKVGLVSTRRNDPSFPNYLVAMQQASIQMLKQPMNVAPLSAESLADQANALSERGVEIYLVDSPDPLDAQDFFEKSKVLDRKASLIAKTMARGFYPGQVVDTPVLYGESVGNEAIRRVGDVAVQVAYVLEEVDAELPIEDQKEKILETFNRPFDNVAKNIERVQIDLNTYQKGLATPKVVCLLTEQDTKKYAAKARELFPNAVIIGVGETKEAIAAYDKNQIDIRIRPDYVRMLQNAIQEANQKSQLPIVLHPAADFNWANLEKRNK